MEKLNNPLPCTCRSLHKKCDPSRCLQAQHSRAPEGSNTLKDFWNSVQNGCHTCATIVSGLLIPEIRDVWKRSIDEELRTGRAPKDKGLHDEKKIGIHLMPDEEGRTIVRTVASGGSLGWRHFDFRYSDPPGEQTSCKAFGQSRCLPSDRTDSVASFEHLNTWIKNCDTKHDCYPRDLPPMPKRVLRIGDNRVSLFHTGSFRARYMTLSHRWGDMEDTTLTDRNKQYMTRDIPSHSLPKTYQEAISIARKLGIDFIWIDSLCIIQDNTEDWDEQSQQMRNIYGNSYLNIAANESQNSSGGCFRIGNADTKYPERVVPINPSVLIRQQPHYTHLDYGGNYLTTDRSPILLKRGWVLQERLLPPRVVYYGRDELVWECNNISDCQCGGVLVIARFKSAYHRALSGGDPLPFSWMRVAERYAGMRLTYDKDRLIALSGIAQQAAETGRAGTYLAGIWSENLAHQLCWELIDTFRKPEQYLAPSWSWTSVFGLIEYSNRMDFSARASIIDVKIMEAVCEPAGEDPTGAVKSGRIELNGSLAKMRTSIIGDVSDTDLNHYCLTHPETKVEYSGFMPDCIMSKEAAQSITEVLILYWGRIWQNRETFMVLKSVRVQSRNDEGNGNSGDIGGVGSGTYERLGIFDLHPSQDKDRFKQLKEICEYKENIILV